MNLLFCFSSFAHKKKGRRSHACEENVSLSACCWRLAVVTEQACLRAAQQPSVWWAAGRCAPWRQGGARLRCGICRPRPRRSARWRALARRVTGAWQTPRCHHGDRDLRCCVDSGGSRPLLRLLRVAPLLVHTCVSCRSWVVRSVVQTTARPVCRALDRTWCAWRGWSPCKKPYRMRARDMRLCNRGSGRLRPADAGLA